jgi:tetratricopeptide (TPR) repeat protein
LHRLICIAALFALTTPARADDDSAFERGLELFKAEDFAGAVPLLEQAHAAAPADADIALLLGISYYRTHDADHARPLLEQAERDGDGDDKGSARIFLGLIADEEGHDEKARAYYEQVSRASPGLGASARLLIDQAGPARWLLVGVMRPGFDSNVELLPMTSGRGRGKGSADGELDLVLAVSARLVEGVPLVVDQTLSYSKQAQLTDYDMLADRVGATYVLAGGRERATFAYHLEASRLGGVKYELAHVGEVGYRHQLRDALSAGARYMFAARDYGGAYEGYTGLTHTGVVEIVRGTRSSAVQLAAGYQVEHEGTDDSTLTMLGHGPRGDGRFRLWPKGELRATLKLEDRMYPARRDVFVSAESALYIDLSSMIGLVTGGSFATDQSTQKNFGYMKWTVFAGMIVVVSD